MNSSPSVPFLNFSRDLHNTFSDEPRSAKMWWMTEKERQMCIERMIDEDRDAKDVSWNLSMFKHILAAWQFYGFCLAWGLVTFH